MANYERVHHDNHNDEVDDSNQRLVSGDDDGGHHKTPVAWNGPPKHWLFKSPWALHLGISIAAGTTMLLFGYEQGVFGGIIVADQFQDYFHHPSPGVEGFVVSVYDLGCFVGALLTLVVGEKLGRKRMLILFTIIMGIGIVMQTAAGNMTHMIWGRVIAGIGNGGNTATAPVWHVETSHQSAKGSSVAKEMAVNVLGFVISNYVTLALSPLMDDLQWRFPLGVQLIFVVIILTFVPLLPESPRWLLARKRYDEAKHVLALLNDHDIEEEFQQIKESVQAEQAAQTGWAKLFRGGLETRRVVLGMILQSCQQLSGVNVLAYYLPVVLHRSVALPQPTARLVASGVATSFFITQTLSYFWVERIGRRRLLMFGAVGMSVAYLGCCIGIGAADAEEDGKAAGIGAVVCIWLFFTMFSSGWLTVPWLYPAEVNSLSMRTKGAALATACDWLFNYVVVQTTPPGIEHLKWGLYLIYAILNASFVPLVYYLVVETKGRSLEDTDRWFEVNRQWLVHKADHRVHGDSTEMGMRSMKGRGDFVPLRGAEDEVALAKAFDTHSDDEYSIGTPSEDGSPRPSTSSLAR